MRRDPRRQWLDWMDRLAEHLAERLLERGTDCVPPESATPAETPLERACGALGVTPTAPREVVDAAFRVLAAAYHPDKGGSAEMFRSIVAARDTLYEARGWRVRG